MAFPATLVQKLEKDAEKPEEGTDKMFRYLVENGASLIEDDPRHGLFAYTTLGFEENRLTIIDRYSTTERRWMPSRFKK
ncbi:MAG: hypothetical protein JWM96_460 [Alphaproteobacteria bacterium]|nr:hypothetical protein [Alphaproteobacteria bacterium]